jgi:SAM-dependent methyltransferase
MADTIESCIMCDNDVTRERGEEMLTPEAAANLALWNGWTEIHMAGAYDVEGFVADPAAHPFDHVIAGVMGDVSGRRLLHLQCHVGLDTMRRGGAGGREVVGVDFSPKAVAAARSIAERMGIAATFVEADVCALPEAVPREAFDVVFTSYGTIMWLADLEPWADSIVSRLAPGGVFHIVDAHPFLSVFEDESDAPPLRVRYPYFSREANYYREKGSYADREVDFVADSYFWQHTFEEIVGVLLRRGLVVESLREYPVVSWQAMDFMVPDDDGLWRLPPEAGDIPLMFSLSARKPA